MTAVLVLSWARRGALDKWPVDRIVEIPKVGAHVRESDIDISNADIPASMARVLSLRWVKPGSAQCQDPEVYAGDLGEETRPVGQMNRRGGSEEMQLQWSRMPKSIWGGSRSTRKHETGDGMYHVIRNGPLRHPAVCTT